MRRSEGGRDWEPHRQEAIWKENYLDSIHGGELWPAKPIERETGEMSVHRRRRRTVKWKGLSEFNITVENWTSQFWNSSTGSNLKANCKSIYSYDVCCKITFMYILADFRQRIDRLYMTVGSISVTVSDAAVSFPKARLRIMLEKLLLSHFEMCVCACLIINFRFLQHPHRLMVFAGISLFTGA